LLVAFQCQKLAELHGSFFAPFNDNFSAEDRRRELTMVRLEPLVRRILNMFKNIL
jgi:hypothetical protein